LGILNLLVSVVGLDTGNGAGTVGMIIWLILSGHLFNHPAVRFLTL